MKQLRALATVTVLLMFLFSCGKGGQGSKNTSSMMDRDDTVKSAWMEIRRENPDLVREEIYAELDKFEAEVISESWAGRESINVSGRLIIEVPSSRFLEMVNWLKKTYGITSLDLYARKQNKYDISDGAVREGVVYSEIHINIEKPVSSFNSFRLGLSHAGDAFRFSLEVFVPVIVFLSPFALLVILIIVAVRVVRWIIRRKKK